jgi:ABC-type amino acid transport system permease subunit
MDMWIILFGPPIMAICVYLIICIGLNLILKYLEREYEIDAGLY